MIGRPRDSYYTSKKFAARITPFPGESAEGRFAAWLPTKTAGTHFCSRHPATQLVLNLAQSGIRNAYNDDECSIGSWENREIVAGVFNFKAELDCPACRCHYASCPSEFHESSFDTFDTSNQERANALALCREFLAQINSKGCGWALLVGRPGTGKTRLGCNLVREWEKRDALYVRQGQLTGELRSTYGRKDVYIHKRERSDEEDDDETPTLLEIVQAVSFFVLDEIGCTALANDERLFLDELLKHRYENRKPTILISNLPINALKDLLGDALYDRIRHASGGGRYIFQFEGDSYRRETGDSYLEGLG